MKKPNHKAKLKDILRFVLYIPRRQSGSGISLLIMFFILSMLYSSSVHAQALDLSVSPPIFQIEVTPPATVLAKDDLTVENTGDQPLVLDLTFRAFKPSSLENGIPAFLDATKPIPGANPKIIERIEILEDGEPISRLKIAPKQTKKLALKVTIPKDEPPSDYYLTIIFLSKQAENEIKESNSITTGGVGVNLLLSVGPKSQTTAVLEEFSTPFFTEAGPVPFTVRLKNTSQHFLYPQGVITVKNMFGQTIGQIELLPVNVLAGSTRAFPSKEQFSFLAEREENQAKNDKDLKELPTDKLDLSRPRAFWNEHFLLGPYSATLEMALTDEGPVIRKTIHFLGFPLYILIGLAVAIMVVLFIRSRLHKRESD